MGDWNDHARHHPDAEIADFFGVRIDDLFSVDHEDELQCDRILFS